MEEMRKEGAAAINFELENMSWDNLKRKRAFYCGVPLTLKEEWAGPKELMPFHKVPDVLPIKPR